MTELEQIISLHEKLIYKIASKFHEISKEDLYQAGVIGIIKAYNNYDKQSETKFTTYAYNYIFGEMYELANNTRTIRLNKNILKTYKKIEQARQQLAQKLGYYPSITELSKFLSIPESTINEIETCTGTIMSLDVEEERRVAQHRLEELEDIAKEKELFKINEKVKLRLNIHQLNLKLMKKQS